MPAANIIPIGLDTDYREIARTLADTAATVHEAAFALPKGAERMRQRRIGFELEAASAAISKVAALIAEGRQSS